jgi:hypothetical protein
MRRVPFRIVVIGDFGLAPERLHGFENQDPDEVLAGARPRLDVTVADHLGGGDRPLSIGMEIVALRDFSSTRLLKNVTELSKAVAALDSRHKGAAPSDVSRDQPGLATGATSLPKPLPPETPSEPPALETSPGDHSSGDQPAGDPPSSDDPLERLFDIVDSGGSSTGDGNASPSAENDDPAKRAVSAFIGSISRRKPAVAKNANNAAAIEAERRIAAQLAAIVDDPGFRALETCWRGLRFLLRHSDRREQCFVHVISAAKEEAANAARAILVDAAEQHPAGFGLIVSAHEYGSGVGDIAHLQALAELGAEIQVPVLAAANNDFIRDGVDLSRHRDPETLFQNPSYAPWSSLRMKPVSRWLGLTVNRFRLRPAHDLVAERDLGFSEASGVRAVGAPLDVGGAWMVAALAAESAAATGWPTDLADRGKVIDGLPLYETETPDANVYAVAMPLRPDAAASLANAGLITLIGQANRDIVRLVRLPSVGSKRSGPTGELPREGTLDYQLLLSRLIRQIEGNADLIFAAGSALEMRDALERFLTSLMGPRADVSVVLETEEDGEQVLSVSVATASDILGGVTVNLDFPV